MKQSLTYYILLLVLKLKGLKRDFSKDSIDYAKIRKGDVHQVKAAFFKQKEIRTFKVINTKITEVGSKHNVKGLILFIHGGAFISGPAQHHWDTVKEIAKQTDQTIWMCDYPKSPENGIQVISENIDAVYKHALSEYKAKDISLIGDSVGGTLIAALSQRLVQKNLELPRRIILVSPVMDASMSNAEIDKVDLVDPMLSKKGVLSAKRMCAGDLDLKNAMISPLYGSFENFPQTMMFIGNQDITCPDQKKAVRKLKEANVVLSVIEEDNMPHLWPFLPLMKEAKIALNRIVEELNT